MPGVLDCDAELLDFDNMQGFTLIPLIAVPPFLSYLSCTPQRNSLPENLKGFNQSPKGPLNTMSLENFSTLPH